MRVRQRIMVVGVVMAALGVAALPSAAAKPSGGKSKAVPGARGVPLGPGGRSFYKPPKGLKKGRRGSLIWARPIKAPKGARAFKILYRTKLYNGKRAVASGFVVAPKGRAPRRRRPVLAWAHGTEGLGDNCAPSMASPTPARGLIDYFTYRSRFQQDTGVPALNQFLRAGYVVVATDYAGLGTPGIQQYTVEGSESRNVFDSVRAARYLRRLRAGKRLVALGWSQGGGASITMGEKPRYGGKLKLLGVAGLAPAVNNGPEFARETPPGPINSTSPAHQAALRLNVYGGFQAAYPELDASDLLKAAGVDALDGAYRQCINHLAYVLNSTIGFDPNPTLFRRHTRPLPAEWQQRVSENTNGYVPNVAPQLIMQGTADTVVNPNGTTQYVERACGLGQPIEYTRYRRQTHQTIPLAAKPEYVDWIADRFAGQAPPSDC